MMKVLISSVLLVILVAPNSAANRARQDQEITATRELRAAYDKRSNTWGYNWTVRIKCNGRPPREYSLSIEQYFDLYSDAVNAAIDAGRATETFSGKTIKRDSVTTTVMTVSTTYRGHCVAPQ